MRSLSSRSRAAVGAESSSRSGLLNASPFVVTRDGVAALIGQEAVESSADGAEALDERHRRHFLPRLGSLRVGSCINAFPLMLRFAPGNGRTEMPSVPSTCLSAG